MARKSSTKTNDITLPKFLKLAKGTMWFDNMGENCSNISLFNTTTKFVGRGYISDDEWNTFESNGYLDSKEIPDDKNKNTSTQHGDYGYVDVDDDKSYFCTEDIPKIKLANIITAYNTGILIEFDPEKPAVDTVDKKLKKDFTFKKDGDMIFNGKNKQMYDKLNNTKHDDLIKFISDAPINARVNLMDLFDYELKGYNRLSRPRDTVLAALRTKLNSLGPTMSPITVEDFESDDDSNN